MNGQFTLGDIVLGEWKLVRLIGEGSFGKVFEAHREDFGRTYKAAIKIITIPQSQSEVLSVQADGMDDESVTAYFHGFVEEMVDEFDLMSKLKGHSNVVSYEDHRVMRHEGTIGWDILIRMELLTPLIRHVRDHAMTKKDVIQLGIDLCKALELCQKYNIIHRDIKPENIFVSDNGDYKLGDFGIARTAEKTTSGLSKKGTYTYMAPEVYREQPYGSSVDIYSLGIVLYWLLNENRTPFLPAYPEKVGHNDRTMALTRRIGGEPIPAPKNAEGRLAEIVLKACAYDPRDRYSSPMQMRQELEAILYNREEGAVIYPNGDVVPNGVGEEPSAPSVQDPVGSHEEEKTDSIFGADAVETEKTDSIFGVGSAGQEKTESIFGKPPVEKTPPSPPAPPTPPAPPPAPPAPPPAAPKKKKRWPLILVGVIALLGLLGTLAFFLVNDHWPWQQEEREEEERDSHISSLKDRDDEETPAADENIVNVGVFSLDGEDFAEIQKQILQLAQELQPTVTRKGTTYTVRLVYGENGTFPDAATAADTFIQAGCKGVLDACNDQYASMELADRMAAAPDCTVISRNNISDALWKESGYDRTENWFSVGYSNVDQAAILADFCFRYNGYSKAILLHDAYVEALDARDQFLDVADYMGGEVVGVLDCGSGDFWERLRDYLMVFGSEAVVVYAGGDLQIQEEIQNICAEMGYSDIPFFMADTLRATSLVNAGETGFADTFDSWCRDNTGSGPEWNPTVAYPIFDAYNLLMNHFADSSGEYLKDLQILKNGVYSSHTVSYYGESGSFVFGSDGNAIRTNTRFPYEGQEFVHTMDLETMAVVDAFSVSADAEAPQVDNELSLVNPGCLTVATNVGYEPYEFYNAGGGLVGIDMELAAMLAEELDLELEVVDMEFDGVLTAVENGETDIAISAISVTDERKARVDFTNYYSANYFDFVALTGTPAAEITDFQSLRDSSLTIGLVAETSAQWWMEEGGYECMLYATSQDLLDALQAGTIDCALFYQPFALEVIEEVPGTVEPSFGLLLDQYAMAVNQSNDALREAVNELLAEWSEDGTLREIANSYMK